MFQVVYYTAAVGIVYDKEMNQQKFFLRHDDDVQCLTMHKDHDTVATGQVPLTACKRFFSLGCVSHTASTARRSAPSLWSGSGPRRA